MKLGVTTICRRNKAVNVVAKFNDSGRCTVDAVTVRTPIEGYNSPVAQVIVFASLGKLQLMPPSNASSLFLVFNKLSCMVKEHVQVLQDWTVFPTLMVYAVKQNTQSSLTVGLSR